MSKPAQELAPDGPAAATGAAVTGAGAQADAVLLPLTLTQAEANDALRLLLEAQRALPGRHVVVDGSALQRFDSAAVAVLLACRREALAAGRGFAVRDLPPRLQDLAAVYGVGELLPQALTAPSTQPLA